jgi:Rrf2 family protein
MMQVSTRTEYGLRCLLLLAREPEGGSLSITGIAAKEHLPKHYVQQILMRLRRSGFVKSTRGTQGGFALAKSSADISIGGVLRVLEGVPFKDTCDHFNRKTDCGHLGACSIRPIWETISLRLWEALDHINLQQLLPEEKTVSQRLAVELPVLNMPATGHSSSPSF